MIFYEKKIYDLFLNVIFYGNLFLHFKCWSDAMFCLVFFKQITKTHHT